MKRLMLLRAVPALLLAGACRSSEPTKGETSARDPEVEQVLDDATAAPEPTETSDGETSDARDAEADAPLTPTALAYGDARGRLPELVAAALAPDGQALVGVSTTGAIVMSRPLGAAATRLATETGARQIAWLPADPEAALGERVVTVHGERIEVREPDTFTLLRSIPEVFHAELRGIGHDASGRRLIVCDAEAVRVFDARFGERVLFKAAEGRSPWEACAIDRAGLWAVAANNLGELHAFEIASKRRVKKLRLRDEIDESSGASVHTLAFNAAGDGVLALVDAEYHGMRSVVVGVPGFRRLGERVRPAELARSAVHPDFDALVALGHFGEVHLVRSEDRPSEESPAALRRLGRKGLALARPDGEGFVIAAGGVTLLALDGTLQDLQDEPRAHLLALSGPRADGSLLAIDDDGRLLVLSEREGRGEVRVSARISHTYKALIGADDKTVLGVNGLDNATCWARDEAGTAIGELALEAEPGMTRGVVAGPRRAFFSATSGLIECDFDAARARFVSFGEQHQHAITTGLAVDPAAPGTVWAAVGNELLRVDPEGGAPTAFRVCPKDRPGPHKVAVTAGLVALSCGSSLVSMRASAPGPSEALAELGEHVLSLSISDDAAWVAAITALHVHLVRVADRRVVARFDALSGGVKLPAPPRFGRVGAADDAIPVVWFQGADGRVVRQPLMDAP